MSQNQTPNQKNDKRLTADNRILAIVGPTASGKTQLALEIAKKIPAEIISADSMQVYKGMDIATAKTTKDVRKKITHHLIDVVSIDEPFNAVIYQKLAREAIKNVLAKKKLPIIVGGSGLYITAAIYDLKFSKESENKDVRKKLEAELKNKGLEFLQNKLKNSDPKAFEMIDTNNSRRLIRALEIIEKTGKLYSKQIQSLNKLKPIYNSKIVGLTLPRQKLYRRINKRVDAMIEKGLLNETNTLLKKGFKSALVAKQALGYKEIINYLDGSESFEEAVETLKKRTRHFAKRQYAWFKRYSNVSWFDPTQASIEQISQKVLFLL